MKIIQFFFVVTLCTTFSCSDPKAETEVPTAAAAVTEALTQPIAEKVEAVAEKLKTEEVESIVKEVAKVEEVKETKEEASKVEKKSAAYLKASEERRKKRQAAREEKRRKEAAKKDLLIKTTSKTESSTTVVKVKEEEVDELKHTAFGTPKVKFKETEFDFGVIKQGEKIQHNFVFENTGSGDLEIINVDVTCGCTTPSFPFIPIAPGEKGTIGVSYNSTGKLGNQRPMITIVTNAKPHTYKIYLKGVVDAERAKPKDAEVEN